MLSREDQLHFRVLKGNTAAFEFIKTLFAVLHTWDDLIDRDKPVGAADIHAAMWGALIEIPQNAFYQTHFHSLMPVLKLAIINWHTANTMEANQDELDKHIAFILRSTYVDLVTVCAFIIGGRAWALEVAYEVRHDTSLEGFDNFLAALANEKREVA